MTNETREEPEADPICPICGLWAAYKKSDAAKHVRGMQREGLLLVRSLLNACVGKGEGRGDETQQERPDAE